ncbi:GNAT family N-acetyltransferase [Pseudomonas asuensis]|uniref:N-acetyltransferase n=1 Tax=Pseudomonas asuensis TaxID=1825787 RepID=A0ABQ2H0D9_9PSED|nr:GNAT family N-acetyltransferase [Pseudomonas asuensis]GGM23127.1 N-acetyltransferase [Pseudomonas asuensis]
MSELQYKLLSPERRPLIDKFYRAHGSAMRTAKGDGVHYWVARRQEILGALNLSPVEHGYWLTGLFVAHPERGQGIAGRLLNLAVHHTQSPVWLFCHPELMPLYQASGFQADPALPESLIDKFQRYRQNKPLIALEYVPL